MKEKLSHYFAIGDMAVPISACASIKGRRYRQRREFQFAMRNPSAITLAGLDVLALIVRNASGDGETDLAVRAGPNVLFFALIASERPEPGLKEAGLPTFGVRRTAKDEADLSAVYHQPPRIKVDQPQWNWACQRGKPPS